jgi:hypothetical protein
VLGDMPSLAMQEIHEALAAFQDQAREDALQRAKQEEQNKMKEGQRRPAEGARQPQTSLPGNSPATRETPRESKTGKQITLGLSLGDSEQGYSRLFASHAHITLVITLLSLGHVEISSVRRPGKRCDAMLVNRWHEGSPHQGFRLCRTSWWNPSWRSRAHYRRGRCEREDCNSA